MRKAITLALWVTAITAHSQINKDPTVKQVDDLLVNSRYEEALRLIDSQDPTDTERKTWLACKKAEALIRSNRSEEAGHVLGSLIGQPALPDGSAPRALLRSMEGLLHMNQGRFDLAEEDLLISRSGFSNLTGYPLETAQNLATLGLVHLSTGKYSQAEEQMLMALRLRQENLPESHELIAASYNDLGLVYSQTNTDKALDYYEMALAIYEKIHGREHPKIAIANTNMGVAYRSLELYGDAVNHFETARKIWDALHSGNHPSKAFVLTNLGRTYGGMGDDKASLEYYQKALEMYEALHGNKHPDVAYTYNLIGNVHASRDEYELALTNYQKALVANVSGFTEVQVERNPDGREFYNGTSLLFSLMLKSEALEGRYVNRTLKQDDLDLALATLQVCDSLIDRLRQQATAEADKLSLGSLANEVYADGVRISTLLSEVAFKKKSYRESAFYFAEKSKSAVLLDAISDADAKSFASIPQELLEEEKSIKASIALMSQKLASKPGPEEENYLRDVLYQLGHSYETFTQKLEKDYPDYFDLKFNTTSPAVGDIQALLREDQLMLSYFVDEKNNRLYVFEIGAEYYQIFSHSLFADFDRYITGFRNSMFFMEDKVFKMTSRNLARTLLPNRIPSAVRTLIILPTGRLGIIPFEALLTEKIDEDLKQEFSQLPFLIKRYSVQYEFSASLILQKKRKTSGSGIQSAMLCAPVNFPDKDKLRDLPGTKTEIAAINSMLEGRNISSQLLLGGIATEDALKSGKVKEVGLLHLATHGIVNETNPELSCIFLQTGDQEEDGNLYSGEIYNLSLNADLVTLSACQTGLGKISKGEGVIGLSRALVYAGARNLIVSFWSVADESTAALMTDFYSRLLDSGGSNYAESLRQAKLNLIRGKYSPPYYWAPFVLIGF